MTAADGTVPKTPPVRLWRSASRCHNLQLEFNFPIKHPDYATVYTATEPSIILCRTV